MISRIMIAVLLMCIFFAFAGKKGYKDGTFQGISKSIYTNEPYYGHSTIKIQNGEIIDVEFVIRDSAKHVEFDDEYEKYFAGNELYMDQCRKNRVGVISYPDSLLKYQNIDKVDAMSGATWSCNIFKASVKEALKQAR
ncbi:FMN-binding protein [Anaerophaga thermohalophila]|jgi:major membrane immunogen (membrane-anchored lipoprotein)|uniref:FMN-binding protein n=1 Tax=Anaerophaga thermohalophila TaxID=177400 RepID=UPI0002F34854|nr:FMN-binding protein [Anaerophaga thermohalophila]